MLDFKLYWLWSGKTDKSYCKLVQPLLNAVRYYLTQKEMQYFELNNFTSMLGLYAICV